jgi:hypothetical protein
MAVFKGNLDIDPRGMIFEAYRIEGISIEECRMIFLDWAMNTPQGNTLAYLKELLDEYGANNPEHPMSEVITDGLKKSVNPGKRRGGRTARIQ